MTIRRPLLALLLGATIAASSLVPQLVRRASAQTPASTATIARVDPAATPAAVPTIPTDVDGDIASLPTIYKDFAEGGAKTLLGAGLMLMVLLSIWNLYLAPKLNVPGTYTPWISLALGVLGGLATSLASGKPLVPSLIYGAMVGFAAIGKHETIGNVAAGNGPGS